MEFHLVAELFRKSLDFAGGSLEAGEFSRFLCKGAWCFALGLLDHDRPPTWPRSRERSRCVKALTVIGNEWIAAIEARIEATAECPL